MSGLKNQCSYTSEPKNQFSEAVVKRWQGSVHLTVTINLVYTLLCRSTIYLTFNCLWKKSVFKLTNKTILLQTLRHLENEYETCCFPVVMMPCLYLRHCQGIWAECYESNAALSTLQLLKSERTLAAYNIDL